MRLAPEWLFEGAEGATRGEVFRWWERRRLHFNLYVALVGIARWILVAVAGSASVKPGVGFEEPLAMISRPSLFVCMANLCNFLGFAFDELFYRRRPRVPLFKAGLFSSVELTALPGIWAVAAWLITVQTGKKLD